MASAPMHTKGTAHTARPWVGWQDWISILLGVFLIVGPLLVADLPNAWFMPLGVFAIILSIWGLGTSSSPASESLQIVVGIILFIAPWIGSFADVATAAWTAWIVGIALIALAVAGMVMTQPKPAPKTHTT